MAKRKRNFMERLQRLARSCFAGYMEHFEGSGLGALVRAVYRQALMDLQPFVRNGRLLEDTWWQASFMQRARALSAALFLANDFPGAQRIVSRLLALFQGPEEVTELLLMGQYAGLLDQLPNLCFRCGRMERKRGSIWRVVFSPPPSLPSFYHWRYSALPENHVPLCRTCANHAFLPHAEEVRVLWGRAVWGVRFSAFERLHFDYFTHGHGPAYWDKEIHPAWPGDFAVGAGWALGEGVWKFRYPYPESVLRQEIHRQAAQELLRRFPLSERNQVHSLLIEVAEGMNERV